MIKPLTLLTILLSGAAFAVTDSEAEKLLTMPLENIDSATDSLQGDNSKRAPASDCLLTPSVDASLASPVVGVIDRVLVQRGDLVKKGQILVKLRSEVEQATLKLNQAQADYGQRTIQRNIGRSAEHTSELQSPDPLVCRLLLEKKKNINTLLRRSITSNQVNVTQHLYKNR